MGEELAQRPDKLHDPAFLAGLIHARISELGANVEALQASNFGVEDGVLKQLSAMASIQGELGDAIEGFREHTRNARGENERRAANQSEALDAERSEAAALRSKLSALQAKLAQFKETADETAAETAQAVSEHFSSLVSGQKSGVERGELAQAR